MSQSFMSPSLEERGKEIIKQLEAGKLPQMVDWFDPFVLVMVALRTLVSSTIGEYADQRPMQEAADGQRDMKRLVQRHDYHVIDKKVNAVLPPEANKHNDYWDEKEFQAATGEDKSLLQSRRDRRLKLDHSGALWIDFIADLGDGFEATYAMAYLLAHPELSVRGVTRKDGHEPLRAGEILILGGDLAYPNATEEEYRTRCLEPYNWAYPFTPEGEKREPERELFFIAGNHDWYDGLAAFSNQFCYETSAVGGWRCRQQRSYFALQLPYGWWIWGVDVALGDSLDVAQRHYFEAIAKRVEKGDQIIIVLHAPDWLKPEYKALSMVCQLARQNGQVCLLLAGDLHHYSHYVSNPGPRDPKMHLITSGGGGAFTHPTHDQKMRIKVSEEVAGGPHAAESQRTGGSRWRATGKVGEQIGFRATKKQFYPTRNQSRRLALRNLLLPLHNRRFALFLGTVYMIYAWVFQISVADPTLAMKHAQYVSIEMQCRGENPGAPRAANACSAERKSAFDNKLAQLTTPAASLSWEQRVNWQVMSAQFSPDRVLDGMLASPAFFFLVAALWIGLVQYADVTLSWLWLKWPIKLAFGTAHAAAHLAVLLATNSVLGLIYNYFVDAHSLIEKVFGVGLYTVLMVIVGGTLGAFVFGIYWVVTSLLFGMHPDSFSALGITKYKNFLRMKFEPGKLTIYPIALDKVPGRTGWKPYSGKSVSLIDPKKELAPRLIETPIKIGPGHLSV
jgi:calcineurin-like phosphoesterase family protein